MLILSKPKFVLNYETYQGIHNTHNNLPITLSYEYHNNLDEYLNPKILSLLCWWLHSIIFISEQVLGCLFSKKFTQQGKKFPDLQDPYIKIYQYLICKFNQHKPGCKLSIQTRQYTKTYLAPPKDWKSNLQLSTLSQT